MAGQRDTVSASFTTLHVGGKTGELDGVGFPEAWPEE